MGDFYIGEWNTRRLRLCKNHAITKSLNSPMLPGNF